MEDSLATLYLLSLFFNWLIFLFSTGEEYGISMTHRDDFYLSGMK